MFQELGSFVFKTIADIQTGRAEAPYKNPNCQLEMYVVLISFFKQDHVNFSPPIHLAIALLQVGLLSPNAEISKICRDGLDLIEKISQPVCPSLEFIRFEENIKETTFKSTDLTDIDLLESRTDNGEILDGQTNFDEEEDEVKEEESIESVPNLEESYIHSSQHENKVKIVSDVLIEVNGSDRNIIDYETSNDVLLVHEKQTVEEKVNVLIDNTVIKTKESNASSIVDIVNIKEESEEPVPKKSKHDDNIMLEDMFNSFQDIVQE